MIDCSTKFLTARTVSGKEVAVTVLEFTVVIGEIKNYIMRI